MNRREGCVSPNGVPSKKRGLSLYRIIGRNKTITNGHMLGLEVLSLKYMSSEIHLFFNLYKKLHDIS